MNPLTLTLSILGLVVNFAGVLIPALQSKKSNKPHNKELLDRCESKEEQDNSKTQNQNPHSKDDDPEKQ